MMTATRRRWRLVVTRKVEVRGSVHAARLLVFSAAGFVAATVFLWLLVLRVT